MFNIVQCRQTLNKFATHILAFLVILFRLRRVKIKFAWGWYSSENLIVPFWNNLAHKYKKDLSNNFQGVKRIDVRDENREKAAALYSHHSFNFLIPLFWCFLNFTFFIFFVILWFCDLCCCCHKNNFIFYIVLLCFVFWSDWYIKLVYLSFIFTMSVISSRYYLSNPHNINPITRVWNERILGKLYKIIIKMCRSFEIN